MPGRHRAKSKKDCPSHGTKVTTEENGKIKCVFCGQIVWEK